MSSSQMGLQAFRTCPSAGARARPLFDRPEYNAFWTDPDPAGAGRPFAAGPQAFLPTALRSATRLHPRRRCGISVAMPPRRNLEIEPLTGNEIDNLLAHEPTSTEPIVHMLHPGKLRPLHRYASPSICSAATSGRVENFCPVTQDHALVRQGLARMGIDKANADRLRASPSLVVAQATRPSA